MSHAKYLNNSLKAPGTRLNSLLVRIGEDTEDEESPEADEIDLEMSPPLKKSKKPLSLSKSSKYQLNSQKKKFEKSYSKIKIPSQTDNKLNDNLVLSFRQFTSHLPQWGGNISVNLNDFELKEFEHLKDYNTYLIINTCTIDYFLFALWYSSKISEKVSNGLKRQGDLFKKINQIVRLIDEDLWDRAKTIWLLLFLKLNPNETNTFDTYGNVYGYFVQYLIQAQQFEYTCIPCKYTVKRKELILTKKNIVATLSFNETRCRLCKSDLTNTPTKFSVIPLWLFVEINALTPLKISETPQNLCFGDLNYNFVCAIFYDDEKKHFLSLFKLNNIIYLVDDLKNKKVSDKIPSKSELSWCMYHLV